ncbi:hypothetical protein [Macrococcus capreoli]|uniref:hypothetical protein n=1 Tax=Macrococcus capreoli TaxID=2982690 RepID=UPI0021D60385|nr:hypothetical protein [Macrococcus sp. TMW 2.2395]MCU7556581.1 hypothetical protein [Macrococcus sp. TMW 2.2395]
MAKVIVEIYFTYGKQDGEELHDSYVTEDSASMRNDLFDYWTEYAAHTEGDRDDFVAGYIDDVFIERGGGDWDDPTGCAIVITTYEQKKAAIERQYKRELARLNEQFGLEDE